MSRCAISISILFLVTGGLAGAQWRDPARIGAEDALPAVFLPRLVGGDGESVWPRFSPPKLPDGAGLLPGMENAAAQVREGVVHLVYESSPGDEGARIFYRRRAVGAGSWGPGEEVAAPGFAAAALPRGARPPEGARVLGCHNPRLLAVPDGRVHVVYFVDVRDTRGALRRGLVHRCREPGGAWSAYHAVIPDVNLVPPDLALGPAGGLYLVCVRRDIPWLARHPQPCSGGPWLTSMVSMRPTERVAVTVTEERGAVKTHVLYRTGAENPRDREILYTYRW